MSDLPLRTHIHVRQGAYLPHWTLDGAIYHVVFRLHDSLPASAVARYRAESEALLTTVARQGADPMKIEAQRHALFSERIESVLDRGQGVCWLKREDIAAVMAVALRHFDGLHYILHAWCIVPNHVHAVVQPKSGYALPGILKSWKGFTANEANRLLSRHGEFWQPEYYDHIIRDEAEFAQTRQYVQDNPRRAGFQNWPWVWPPSE